MSKAIVKTTEVGDYWETEDDALTDVLTMSAFTDEKKFVQSVRKPNIGLSKKIITKKSIYDAVSSDEELDEAASGIQKEKDELKRVPMGRGYVIQKYMQRHVGNCSPTAFEETERSIREIFPLGFSNEVIEAVYKNPTQSSVIPEPMEQLRFRPASSGSSSVSSSGKRPIRKAQNEETASNSSSASCILTTNYKD